MDLQSLVVVWMLPTWPESILPTDVNVDTAETDIAIAMKHRKHRAAI
ncbi:hypothetical protein [Corynebacterium freiburgense]|nr:hypothetical protein [Corynebacterium freiburgense]